MGALVYAWGPKHPRILLQLAVIAVWRDGRPVRGCGGDDGAHGRLCPSYIAWPTIFEQTSDVFLVSSGVDKVDGLE